MMNGGTFIETGTLGAKDCKYNAPNCKYKDNNSGFIMLSLRCLCIIQLELFSIESKDIGRTEF